MNTIRRIDSNAWPSRAVCCGDLVFLAGMTADDVSQDVAGQTEQVLAKIEGYLREAGSDKRMLLSAQIWLHDIGAWQAVTDVWCRWIDPGHPPARAVVGATLDRGHLVEIMVTAARSPS
ncbi:MAG TPA: RidA family protein [Ramlibacter sp.]|uniref:RidA family protein n=1 Tax=Ramlibacter sp. TaxID=1917967 RepID=UPI002CA2BE59|nr:RidA family protein [Ramlibacter sp.]HVZ45429.1 RidA family protein [Ramlibacter sp.]